MKTVSTAKTRPFAFHLGDVNNSKTLRTNPFPLLQRLRHYPKQLHIQKSTTLTHTSKPAPTTTKMEAYFPPRYYEPRSGFLTFALVMGPVMFILLAGFVAAVYDMTSKSSPGKSHHSLVSE